MWTLLEAEAKGKVGDTYPALNHMPEAGVWLTSHLSPELG